MIARGEPIVGGGAGIGLSAKCEEAGGIDLIVIYNSGRYRMAGRGSLAGLMPYGDANQIVLEMAAEVLPVVTRTPVLAGVNGTDPFRVMDAFLDQLKAMGFSGVQNFPDGGADRRHLPRQSRGDRDVLRSRGRHDRAGPCQGPADHTLCVLRGRRAGDGQCGCRHHRLPSRPDDRRLRRRADGAQACRLSGARRCLGGGGATRAQRSSSCWCTAARWRSRTTPPSL